MVQTFEREAKQLTEQFKDLIKEYKFEDYDFHSIRQTLIDYIKNNYPNYTDFIESDYIMMLVELFAFQAEMMAYKMDTIMNETYLSTAKERRNIIKIADMLGYKFKRLTPAYAVLKFDLTNSDYGNNFFKKIKIHNNTMDLIDNSYTIKFEPVEAKTQLRYRFDYLLKQSTEQFMVVMNNIFKKLEDFDYKRDIKTKRIIEDGVQLYERSYILDNLESRYEPNHTVYLNYAGETKTFEVQNIKLDRYKYFNTENTEDAIIYDEDNLYSNSTNVAIEFVIKYNDSKEILDKNIYMYNVILQGASYSRPIENIEDEKNRIVTFHEQNIFNNKTLIRQFNDDNKVIRTYQEVQDINSTQFNYAYECNNNEHEEIELLFGDGKNTEPLKKATNTLFYYRKNPYNTDDILNVVNADIANYNIKCIYFDKIEKKQKTEIFMLNPIGKVNAKGGSPADSNEHIKYMARKLRSIQDRLVTASDYEIAGKMHPRVKYASVILRTYIGRNSPRISNEKLDVFINENENDIIFYKDFNILQVKQAYFTDSSVNDKDDYITFIDNKIEYFVEVFNQDEINPNDWIKYPEDIINEKYRGTCLKIINKKITNDLDKLLDISNMNFCIVYDNIIKDLNIKANNKKEIILDLKFELELDEDDFKKYIKDNKEEIIQKMNSIIDKIEIKDIKFDKNLILIYNTKIIEIPDNKTFIWSHYKSDDIYLNPSKSNIIEIYVSGFKKDLEKGIEIYEPLNSNELMTLKNEIEKRKMMSDQIFVFNADVYEVKIAIKVFKSDNYYISDDILLSKVNTQLDRFFDINNIPLGRHFYSSKLIEFLHRNIKEIEHIEFIKDKNGNQITDINTEHTVGIKVNKTQIVEKTKLVNEKFEKDREIIIG